MKHKLLTALCAAALVIFSASAERTVQVNGSDLDTRVTSITFDGDNAVLHFSDGTSATHDMSTVAVLFTTLENGIEPTHTRLLQTLVDDELRIEGTEAGRLLAIFDAAGRQIAQQCTTTEVMHINVAGLPAGVYMLRIGNTTTRFIKR